MTALREAEAQSIRGFLKSHSDKLTGRVLDIGCGQQPYRDIVEAAGGTYLGWDRPDLPGSVGADAGPDWDDLEFAGFDAVMFTQVWQYVPLGALCDALYDLAHGRSVLAPAGWLLATGPTNWPVVEQDDLHRFTTSGVLQLLHDAGFGYIEVHPRHAIEHGGEKWSCGWGAAARG